MLSHQRLHIRRLLPSVVLCVALLSAGVATVLFLREAFAGRISVDPIAMQLGSVEIHWYGIFIALSVGLGIPWTVRRFGAATSAQLETVLWLSVLGGVVGARLGYVVQNLAEYAANPVSIVALSSGGLSIHGMLLGGIATAYGLSRLYRIHFLQLADAATPALLLGMVLGRFGNFTNGELIGTPTNVAWKMVISTATGSVGVHPIFLYDALLNGLLLFLLLRTSHLSAVRGELFARFLVGISVTRFIVEFFRANDPPTTGALSLAQGVSIGLGLIGLLLLLVVRRQRVAR